MNRRQSEVGGACRPPCRRHEAAGQAVLAPPPIDPADVTA
jgi:hypothetical protein